ncbi:Uncharacterized protein DAT39_001901, partial [Clarias magur]
MGFDIPLKPFYNSGCLHDKVVVIQIGDDRCLVNWNNGGPHDAQRNDLTDLGTVVASVTTLAADLQHPL